MAELIDSRIEALPSAIGSHSLSFFVYQAEKALKQGKTSLTIKGSPNKKIGEIFARAVVDAAILSQIESVEKRYGISLSRISNQKEELKVDHVLAFALGILNPAEATIKELSSTPSASVSLKDKEKSFLIKDHYNTTFLQRKELGTVVTKIDLSQYCSLIDPSTYSHLILDKLMQELAKQTFDIDQLQEVLAKNFGTSALEEGMLIPLPSLINPDTGEITRNTGYYQVYKKISKEGLMAFGLVPLEAPSFIKPMILFRPTALSLEEKEGLKTIAEDMQDEVGKRSFELACRKLEQLLKDPLFIKTGQKGWITGFSLGGAHAARLLAFSPDHFSKAFFFNDPSTETGVALEFAEKLLYSSHTQDNPLDIKIFHNEADDVTLAGAYHVGGIPETFFAKEKAQKLCHVSYVKIKTKHLDLLRDNLFSLAQVELNFRSFFSLMNTTNRIAALEFAKIKQDIHCHVVLSSFNEVPLEEVTGLKSAKSRLFIEERVLQVSDLDQSKCSLSVQFNQKRFNPFIKRIRQVIQYSCFYLAEIKNMVRGYRKTVKRFFVKFSFTKNSSYMPLIEEKFQRLKDQVVKIDIQQFLAVPEAGNPGAPVACINFKEMFSFLEVPPPSR